MRTLKILFGQFKSFYKKQHKYVFTLFLIVLVIVLGVYSVYLRNSKKKLVYADSLDCVAVTVNGTDLNLRQLAFYVAYEEMQVEKEAQVYNPDDTKKYWNLWNFRTDGVFVRVEARNAAMQMAVHDEIFYKMALEEGLELTGEQITFLNNDEEDFWNDLQDYDGAGKLGITREDVHETMEHIALAQYYQTIYARLEGAEYEDYDFAEEAYEALLEKNSYQVNEEVWDRVDFGNVILHN